MSRPVPTMPNPGVPEKRGARPPEWPLDAPRVSDELRQAEQRVIAAAILWRRSVAIAGPPKYPRPKRSTELAEAIDALRALIPPPREAS